MKRLSLGLVVAAALASAGRADAQVVQPIGGNFRYDIAAQAKLTSSNAYGAARAFETLILPALDHEGGWIAKLQTFNLIDAIDIPGQCIELDPGDCGGRAIVNLPVTITTGQAVFAYRWSNVGLFYAGSATYAAYPEYGGSALQFAVNQTRGPLIDANPMIAPFQSLLSVEEGLSKPVFDYVVGGTMATDYVTVYGGYVGSKGFFANFAQPKLHLVFTGMLTDGLKNIPYLRGGLERNPWVMFGREAAKVIGTTSLYGRRLSLVPPKGGVDLSKVDLAQFRHAGSYAFTTFHLAQESMLRWLDASAALATSPSVTPHLVQVGLHTPGFHEAASHSEDAEAAEEMLGGWLSGIGVTAGVVHVPQQIFYGTSGGTHVSLSLEARSPIFRLAIRRNDPDILAIFPFATDAWSVMWTLGSSGNEVDSLRGDE